MVLELDGLDSRDTEHPIIVAGIQSVYKRAAVPLTLDLLFRIPLVRREDRKRPRSMKA
jgi:hypothetical protein